MMDKLGASFSALCALHCALCASLPGLLLVLGLDMLLSSRSEWIFTLLIISVAFFSLYQVRKSQKPSIVTKLLLVGILGLLASRGIETGTHHHHEASLHEASLHEESLNETKYHHLQDTHNATSQTQSTRGSEEHATTASPHEDTPLVDLHMAGAIIGILSGILIFSGHLLSLKNAESTKETAAIGV